MLFRSRRGGGGGGDGGKITVTPTACQLDRNSNAIPVLCICSLVLLRPFLCQYGLLRLSFNFLWVASGWVVRGLVQRRGRLWYRDTLIGQLLTTQLSHRFLNSGVHNIPPCYRAVQLPITTVPTGILQDGKDHQSPQCCYGAN